ncbi:MAG: hypothetical protein WHX52_22795 [Anaerolineae bacterium]
MSEEHLTIAKKLLRDRNYSAARIALDEILNKDPQNVTALVDLSTALGHLELLNEALEVAQSALNIEPDNPEVHFRLSWVYYKMRELHKAREHACKAITLNPDVGKYHYGMVPVALALRDTDKAFECIETAHRLDSSIFDKNAYIVLWGLRICAGLIKLRGLIAWGIIATYVLLFEIGHDLFLLKLLAAGLPFMGAGVYYLARRRHRRAVGTFILGLLWGSATYAIARWFFL